MRRGSAWFAIVAAAAALLPACSSEPAVQNASQQATAQVPKQAAGGSRLRSPYGPREGRASGPGDELSGCALVDADGAAGDPSPPEGRVSNRVVVNARGEILWNGTPIDAATLGRYLDLVATMIPTPLTIVRTDPGADPKAVEAVRDAVARSLECPLVAY